MTPLQKAKTMLPQIPDEVFDLWIRHCVSKNGWPYDSICDLGDAYWQGYFLGIPLSAIQALIWDQERLPFDLGLIEPETRIMINKMVLLHAHNIDPGVVVPSDSKGRFDSAVTYIKEHGEIPGSIVLLSTLNGFKIFDGWHRLAAVHSLQESSESIVLPSWIATPNKTATKQQTQQDVAPNHE